MFISLSSWTRSGWPLKALILELWLTQYNLHLELTLWFTNKIIESRTMTDAMFISLLNWTLSRWPWKSSNQDQWLTQCLFTSWIEHALVDHDNHRIKYCDRCHVYFSIKLNSLWLTIKSIKFRTMTDAIFFSLCNWTCSSWTLKALTLPL